MTERTSSPSSEPLGGFSLANELPYEDMDQKTELGLVLSKAAEIGQKLAEGEKAIEERGFDKKTGLLDYPTFKEKVRERIENTNRHTDKGRKYALLLADLDDFKRLNKEVGYDEVDDQFLIPVAEEIKKVIRDGSDLATRLGGEEFVLLIADADGEAAKIVAEKLQANTNKLQTPFGPLGISIGISVFEQGTSYESAMKPANDLLDVLKEEAGKNQIAIAA